MLDLLMKRRSIRKYKPEGIEKEKVDQLLKAALLSPTSRNTRAWEYILVTDKDKLEKLSHAKPGAHALKNAPLGIAIIADPEKSDVWVEDTTIAAILIQMTAESLGLGSCWIQIRERFHNKETPSDEYVRGILNIPENMEVEMIVSLGYPDETRAPHTEDEFDYSKIHYEEYGRNS